MKYIDNDMDDLFYKAGQEYPLNADNPNWDAVQKALLEQQTSAPPAATTKKNISRYYPLLLLLIPLMYIWFVNDNGNEHPNRLKVKQETGIDHLTNTSPKVSKVSPNIPNKSSDINRPSPNIQNASPIVSNASSNASKSSPKITNKKLVGKPFIGRSASNNSQREARKVEYRNPTNSKTYIGKNLVAQKQMNKKVSVLIKNRQKKASGKNKSEISALQNVLATSHEQKGETKDTPEENISGLSNFPPLNLFDDFTRVPFAVTSSPSIKNYDQPSNAPVAKTNAVKKSGRFYYELFVGPDVSTIKFQDVKNAGYTTGLLFGYRLNNKWSVLAGATWATKKYYTEGKYFDKVAAGFRAYENIEYLQGGCNMFEFPIGARYESRPGRNSFFATGMVVSSVMKKESYSYKAWGNSGAYPGFKTYDNSGKFLFSNFQFSAGYKYQLFKGINLFIEPYLQMPLRKMGIGKIPITSAGVHFGLMHDIK
jgi:hypothetical protein